MTILSVCIYWFESREMDRGRDTEKVIFYPLVQFPMAVTVGEWQAKDRNLSSLHMWLEVSC